LEEIDILHVLRRHARMIVAVVLISTMVGYGVSFLLPRRYTASALVLVRPQQSVKLDNKATTSQFLDFPMGTAAVETPSKTYIEIIKSPDFVRQLVQKLGLDAQETKPPFLSSILPASMTPVIDDLRQFLKNSISFLRYGRVISENRFADTVKTVKDSVALEALADTYIFSVSYTAEDAQLAADVANATAKLFVDYMERARLTESQYGLDKLNAELTESRQELETARERLKRFKEAHKIFQSATEYDSHLKVIADLEMELARANENLESLGAVANRNTSSTSMRSLEAKRASILNTLQERKDALVGLPAMERELKQLELLDQSALAAYNAVNTKFLEASINNTYAARDVQPVADAVPPQVPSGPKQLIFALVSLLSGLVVGVSLAFLFEYLNRRVRSIRDVEDFVGVKVLATIPRISEMSERNGLGRLGPLAASKRVFRSRRSAAGGRS
jgi:uncharacterized protein involved in exopolysaccharide biosynthesis